MKNPSISLAILATAVCLFGCTQIPSPTAAEATTSAAIADDTNTSGGAATKVANVQERPEATGVIRGQVNFTGTPPAPEAFQIAGDKFCEDLNKTVPITRRDIAVNPNGTLANVIVWISKGGPDWLYDGTNKKTAPAVMLQQGCEFIPRVVAVQTGQQLIVKNADPTLHNVNAQPQNNPRLNKALLPGSEPAVLTFEKPEVAVKLKSDIHPWMIGWAAVFDHPGFAVTGEDGRFELSGVPPGEYTLTAWQEKFGTVTAQLLVTGNVPANAVFTYTNQGSKSGMAVDPHGNPTTGTLQQED